MTFAVSPKYLSNETKIYIFISRIPWVVYIIFLGFFKKFSFSTSGRYLQTSALKSYLTDRTQRRYVNGVLSTEQYVSCGIPHGSILGLLLFIIYVNDFRKCLQHTTPGMFADDTYISTAHADIKLSRIECSLNSDNCST